MVRDNAITCSWILGSIYEDLYANHGCSGSAQEIWANFCETYHKADGSVIFNVNQKINSLTHGSLSLSYYFNKLDSYWKEFDALTNLTECSGEAANSFKNHSKLMKLMQFLSGLDESYG